MKRPQRKRSLLWDVADLYRHLAVLKGLLIVFLLDERHSNDGKVVRLVRPNKPRPPK